MMKQAVHVDDELHSIVLLDGIEAIEFPSEKDNAVAVMKSGERRDLSTEDFCLIVKQVRTLSAHAKMSKCGEMTFPDFFGYIIQDEAMVAANGVIQVTEHDDLFDYYKRRFMNWDKAKIEAENGGPFEPEGILLFRDVGDRCVMALDRSLLDQVLGLVDDHDRPVFYSADEMKGQELQQHLADRFRRVDVAALMVSACEAHHPIAVTEGVAEWFEREGRGNESCPEPDGTISPPSDYDLRMRDFARELRELAGRMTEAGVEI